MDTPPLKVKSHSQLRKSPELKAVGEREKYQHMLTFYSLDIRILSLLHLFMAGDSMLCK